MLQACMPCLTIPCMKGLEVAEQEDIFVVKKIVDERIVEGSYEYRVEWQGYQGQDTWEPYNNILTLRVTPTSPGDALMESWAQALNTAGTPH